MMPPNSSSNMHEHGYLWRFCGWQCPLERCTWLYDIHYIMVMVNFWFEPKKKSSIRYDFGVYILTFKSKIVLSSIPVKFVGKVIVPVDELVDFPL